MTAVAVTLVFWASAFVAIRHLGGLLPGALTLGRLVVGAVLPRRRRAQPRHPRPTGREWVSIVAIGVLWFGVYNVALNAGERRVDAGTAAMLIQVSPVLIALLAAVFLHERFTLYPGSASLAFSGVGLISLSMAESGGEGGGNDVLGVVLCLVSAVVYSISLILQKPLVARLPAIHVMARVHDRRTRLPAFLGSAGRRDPRGADLLGAGSSTRRLPDRDRVHHLRHALRHMSASSQGVTTYLVPPITIVMGVLLPRRGATRHGVRRRRARPGRRRRRPSQAPHGRRRPDGLAAGLTVAIREFRRSSREFWRSRPPEVSTHSTEVSTHSTEVSTQPSCAGLQPAAERLEVAGRFAAQLAPLPLLADRGGEAQLEQGVEGLVGVGEHRAEQPVELVGRDGGQRQAAVEVDVAERVERERDAVHPQVALEQPAVDPLVVLVGLAGTNACTPSVCGPTSRRTMVCSFFSPGNENEKTPSATSSYSTPASARWSRITCAGSPAGSGTLTPPPAAP